MKLLDVAEFYSPQGGGVRTYIEQKLQASIASNWETVIVAPGPEDREEERRGGKIVWVKAPRLPLDPRYHQFVSVGGIHRAIAREEPDVLETSSPWIGGWAVARWPGSCVKSLFLHNDPVAAYPQALLGDWLGTHRVDRLFGWFWLYLRRLRRHVDTMVVGSEWIADRVHRFDLPRPKAIGFGVDPTAFSPTAKCSDARRAMLKACGFTDPDTPLLIAVSRHHPEKKVGTMLKAFAMAQQKRPMALYLVGDGLSRKRVERQAAGIPGVHVAGAITDRDLLARYLASADAFLHGCGFETFGLVIAEAICSGLPLVVPSTGGAAELAHPSFSELYPVGNADACAAAITRMLERDVASMRQPLADKAAAIRSPDMHFHQLFDYYEDLVRRSSSSERHLPASIPVPGSAWAGGISATDARPLRIQASGRSHLDHEDAERDERHHSPRARW